MPSAFPLTVAAIKVLEAHEATSDDLDPSENQAVSNWIARYNVLAADVGRGLAADTSDYNRPEACVELCAFPGGLAWVRGLASRS